MASKRTTVFPEENRIEATWLKGSLFWKLQSKNQLNLVTGSKLREWHLEVRAVGEAFPTREEMLFEKILCFGFKDPWNREVKCRGNSQAWEYQYLHTQLGHINLTVPDTRQKNKIFWRQCFLSRKKEQRGYKIMPFHTKFMSSLVLQAVLAYWLPSWLLCFSSLCDTYLIGKILFQSNKTLLEHSSNKPNSSS